MIIVNDIEQIQNICRDKSNKGFIPTMGALHKGHISLIQKSRLNLDFIIVSIFINPAQFSENEDLDKYPQNAKNDIKICQDNKVDVLFMPLAKDIYQDYEPKIISDKIDAYKLEGINRPSHFDGVLNVVMKLLNIITPNKLYLGKKDAQQIILIEKMIKSFFLNINVIRCESIRDDDGIAMSSRNIYLSKNDRMKLMQVNKALQKCKNKITNNKTKSDIIIEEIRNNLIKLEINYISIVNHKLKQAKYTIISDTIILISVNINNTNYIDNIWL